MIRSCFSLSILFSAFISSVGNSVAATDELFETLAQDYISEFPSLHPISATSLGDHRFDSRVDEISESARENELKFIDRYQVRLLGIDASRLSPAQKVDYALLEHQLRYREWSINDLREWEWNPLVYTELAGSAVYSLMAREFAPLPIRLMHVADRLESFPLMCEQIRAILKPNLVPQIHAETAVKQNQGVMSMLKNMVEPHLSTLTVADRNRLIAAMETAKLAVEKHQKWLEGELLTNADGDFRIGREKYDRKLFYTLQTPLTGQQVRLRAQAELNRVRNQMYEVSKGVYEKSYPYTISPEPPSKEYKQAIIRSALEMAYRDIPARDRIVEAARHSLELTTEFVRNRNLVTIPDDPLEIIVMPEFQRGVSLAYCDSPGPLDVGQKTFYAVAPLPKHWTEIQINSFLREYNIRSIHDLTIHEAMPGHFLQLAHSNRYKGTLRAVLASGTFIEGWAVYTEQMMADEGFLDHDPLMKLIALKWYLRGIANAILDQDVHTVGITREQGMRLMMEETFQEEREAAGKWVRAQLTSAQLSTYFVGYQEHADLRKEVQSAWGDDFELKKYHDQVLSYGSPPVQFVRALMLKANGK